MLRTPLWEKKLEGEPQGFLYQKKLAQLWALRFKVTSDIGDLKTSDSLFVLVNQKVNAKNTVSNYHYLVSNAVSRHDFRRAREWGF